MNYTPSNADMFVYVRRKSGTLLSSFGHDLKIRVGDFTIDADYQAGDVEAHVEADSLEPVASIDWETREETGELSKGDRRKITRNMKHEVVEVEEYPAIEFETTSVDSSNGGWWLEGPLGFNGEARDIEIRAIVEDRRVHAETTIDQTRFHIEPYSAMLGSLKVHPEVVVTVDAPLPEDV
ncbi:MAG: YceI family protein [Bradymonadaceae bacterium]